LIIVLLFQGAALGLCLALMLRLHRRLDGLPARVWDIVRQERDKDERRALAALADAVAAKATSSRASLRVYEEELAASARRQVAEAERLAHLAERRLSEAGPVMETAAQLVRELRATLDGLRAAAGGGIPSRDPDQRPTVEMPRLPTTGEPPGADRDQLSGSPTPGSGARRAGPRSGAHASVAPGSAVVLPSEPGILAAGLGERPREVRRESVAPPPQAPPPHAPPRRRTLLGIRPPAPATTPPPASAAPSQLRPLPAALAPARPLEAAPPALSAAPPPPADARDERLSDSEDEPTQLTQRPSPEQLARGATSSAPVRCAATVPSMAAVSPPGGDPR
jgi:hypothetical protein